MESRRQSKVASVLQEAFIEIMLKHGHNYYGSKFVTLTKVRTTPDLSVARFYISVMVVADRKAAIDGLRDHASEIRKLLGNKMRNQLRHIPTVEFYLDESLDDVFRIEELLKQDQEEAAKRKANNPDTETSE